MINTSIHHHKQKKIKKNKCGKRNHPRTIPSRFNNSIGFCYDDRCTIGNRYIPYFPHNHHWTIYQIPRVQTEKSPNIDTVNSTNQWKTHQNPSNSLVKMLIPVHMKNLEWSKSANKSSNCHHRNIHDVKMEHLRKLSEMDKVSPDIETIWEKYEPQEKTQVMNNSYLLYGKYSKEIRYQSENQIPDKCHISDRSGYPYSNKWKNCTKNTKNRESTNMMRAMKHKSIISSIPDFQNQIQNKKSLFRGIFRVLLIWIWKYILCLFEKRIFLISNNGLHLFHNNWLYISNNLSNYVFWMSEDSISYHKYDNPLDYTVPKFTFSTILFIHYYFIDNIHLFHRSKIGTHIIQKGKKLLSRKYRILCWRTWFEKNNNTSRNNRNNKC